MTCWSLRRTWYTFDLVWVTSRAPRKRSCAKRKQKNFIVMRASLRGPAEERDQRTLFTFNFVRLGLWAQPIREINAHGKRVLSQLMSWETSKKTFRLERLTSCINYPKLKRGAGEARVAHTQLVANQFVANQLVANQLVANQLVATQLVASQLVALGWNCGKIVVKLW